jgi:GNAT superfamily N-acetyltransferase
MKDFALIRTDSRNLQFQALVHKLDAYLAIQDGDEHAFYDQFNKIDSLAHCLVAYKDELPVGCGAIKAFDSVAMEVKRMYVLPEYRGRGIAKQLLNGLEKWAFELNYSKCVLETGIRQPEAVALYTKHGYKRIPNYGQYEGVLNSLCFEKSLIKDNE